MQFTLKELFFHMGLMDQFLVVLMILMSISSLLLTVERIIFFAISSAQSRAYAAKLAPVLIKGDLTAATALGSDKKSGHLGRVLQSGLVALRTVKGNKDLAVESVARALERQAARESANFKRGFAWLATVGSTSPFIGLLGTVIGIVNAFQKMAESGSGGLGTVSAGIAEALVTTATGLIVAIPAVMAFNFLQGWVDARAVDISESSNELLDTVSRTLSGVPTQG